jgi:monofunctional biosynthetic peptidoglycan transglycosylase
MCLNIVEFGPWIYGADAAARSFFGKPAAQLPPRKGALLACAR